MKNSQYTNRYLSLNDARGEAKGLTIGSFLAGELSGRAKTFSGKYAKALENSLKRVGAREGVSKMGKTAWYSAA